MQEIKPGKAYQEYTDFSGQTQSDLPIIFICDVIQIFDKSPYSWPKYHYLK